MMSPRPAPAAAPMATPVAPPITPVDAPTAAPAISPSPAPAAMFPALPVVPGCRPAASAFCWHAATSRWEASRPFNSNLAFARSIGSGPEQPASAITSHDMRILFTGPASCHLPDRRRIFWTLHELLSHVHGPTYSQLLPTAHLISSFLHTPLHI